jgi:DNA repair protein RadC
MTSDAPLQHGTEHRRATRSIRDLPAAERPRERLALRGPGGLSAAELIAVVWGTGSGGRTAVDLAEEALARHASVGALARASDVELAAIPGIGVAKAARLAAAFELGRRSMADWPAGRWTIRSPRDVADRLVVEMGRLEREELRVVALNAKNVVQRVSTAYVGNVSASLVRVGELFRDAVRLDASGVVLVHNHPSGDPTPSPDDLHLTAEAIAAGRLLDIDVLDHVVIGHDAWVSLRDRGVTFDRPRSPRGVASLTETWLWRTLPAKGHGPNRPRGSSSGRRRSGTGSARAESAT